MNKLLGCASLAAAFLAPLTSARAETREWGSFCTTGVVMNFCGSMQVTATPTPDGRTELSFTVLNTSGGTQSGDPGAVFTAIGLDNFGSNADLLADKEHGIADGISSACDPIATGSTTGEHAGCAKGSHTVMISFSTALAAAYLVVNRQGTQSSGCTVGTACSPLALTTTPEPGTLALFGTGIFALTGFLFRRRRRNDTA